MQLYTVLQEAIRPNGVPTQPGQAEQLEQGWG